MNDEAVNFGVAQVGQSAYTWENASGDWGEYTFETVDPFNTYGKHNLHVEEFGPIIRKRWVLTEVTTFELDDDEDDDEDEAS